MAREVKQLFMVQRPPFKSENTKLAFTHALASQTAEIYLEDDESVVPTLAMVGDGIYNVVNNQQGTKHYDVNSNETHAQMALLIDLRVLVCKEDLEARGLSADRLADGSALGADMNIEVVPFSDIQKEMEAADQLLFF